MNKVKLTLSILILTLIQSVLGIYIKVNGIVPDMLFVFALCYAGKEKNIKYVMTVSVILGIISDSLSGRIFGNYIAVYLVSAVLMYVLKDCIFKNSSVINIIFVFLCSIIGKSVFYTMNISVLIECGYWYALMKIILPEAFYNTVCSVFIIFIMDKILFKRKASYR